MFGQSYQLNVGKTPLELSEYICIPPQQGSVPRGEPDRAGHPGKLH